jgi:hypothetical protein
MLVYYVVSKISMDEMRREENLDENPSEHGPR